MSTDSIQDFILRDKENLRIAIAVSQVWPAAHKRLINDFLDRLSTRLLKDFPGWKVDRWKQFLVDQWASLILYKEGWKDEYYIALQSYDDGKGILFGVQRGEKIVETRPLSEKVLEIVQEIYPGARARKWWDAIVTMRSPAADWSTPETMWRMHAEATFLEGVAEQLAAVAKISEPILDRLTRNS